MRVEKRVILFIIFLGIALIVWGSWGLLSALFLLHMLGLVPLWWLTHLAASVASLAAGYLLGYESIRAQFMSNASDELLERTKSWHDRLLQSRRNLGLGCLGLAAWMLLYSVIFFTRMGSGG